MKKIVALLLALCMVFALCACGETKPAEPKAEEAAPAEEVVVEEAPAEEAPAEEAPAVMSYEEFAAAELDSPVVVECYVQAHQSWWDNQITVYAQDPDGAYCLYNMPCSEEDAAKLVPGQKIRVTGVKAEWSGEIEIIDSSFEFLDAEPWIAEPVDATELWGSPDLITYQNRLVSFKDVKIEEYKDDEGKPTGAAFAYKDPDGKTDDLYFKATLGDTTYDFCVEFYLCGKDTDVYKAVEGLQVGDRVDLEGFLYWYNGPNLHTTGIGVKVN